MMKKKLLLLVTMAFCVSLQAQNYNSAPNTQAQFIDATKGLKLPRADSSSWRYTTKDSVGSILYDTVRNKIYLKTPTGAKALSFLDIALQSVRRSNDTLYFSLSSGGEVAIKMTSIPQANIIGLIDTLATLAKRNVSDSLYMGTVSNIASLRSGNYYLTYRNINLLGYYSNSDGGQGTFYWDAANVAVDDSGSVIKPAAVSGAGRWVRIMDKTVNVCWFGAKGDGVTDDSRAIELSFARVPDGGGVYFPTRNNYPSLGTACYIISRTIKITKYMLKVWSDAETNNYSTTIKGTGSGYTMFLLAANHLTLWGLTIRGNGSYTILDPSSGAGRWGDGATINGIKVTGDVVANGELYVHHTTFMYCDTAIITQARNAEIQTSMFSQCKNGMVILPALTGQNRGFKIQNNWIHSIGDTTVNRAVFKCTDPRAFQIWITNNQIDGQTNAIMADIQADSAVQIMANNNSMGRAGMIKLTGTKGAIISNNYYLGGGFKTIGDGIQLTNVTGAIVMGNNIVQAANNGISLVNSTNNSITNNNLLDPSWPGKNTAGNFSGVTLDANSKNNSLFLNFVRISNPSGYPFSKFYDIVDATNHVGLNEQVRTTTFVDSLRMQFNGFIKAPGYMFGPYDSSFQWDMTYRSANTALEIGRTGFYTPMKLYDDGTITMNLANPGNLKGPAMLNVGADLTLRPQLALYNQTTTAYGYIISGNGSPEFSITAPPGSLYMRQNGGAGTTLYIKESGSGNTGWVSHITSSIQNQNAVDQTANFRISGTGAASQFLSPSFNSGISTGVVSHFGGLSTGNRGGEIVLRGGTAASRPGAISFHTGTGGSGSVQQERMSITAAGNVVIGTQTPFSALDVGGDIRAVTPTGGAAYLMSTITNLNRWGLGTINPTEAPGNIGQDFLLASYDTLGAFKDTVMIVKRSTAGFVGIGKTPSYKLDVNGSINGITESPSDNSTKVGSTAWIRGFAVANQISSAQTGNLWVSGTARSSLVSIQGNSNPAIALFDNIGSQVTIQVTGGALDFNNNNSAGTRFSGTANVGVGNNTPSSKLHLGGSLAVPVTTISTNTTLDNTHNIVRTATSGITVTLPTASTCIGRIYEIINESAGSITISSVLVFGTGTTTIPTVTSWRIYSDGTSWRLSSRSN